VEFSPNGSLPNTQVNPPTPEDELGGMTPSDFTQLAWGFRLLEDKYRFRFLQIIQNRHHGKTVTAIAHEMGITQSALSCHICRLRDGGVIDAIREGKNNFYFITEHGLYLLKFCWAYLKHLSTPSLDPPHP
jgi:DNA-binding transcriptional ArsR family regulator